MAIPISRFTKEEVISFASEHPEASMRDIRDAVGLSIGSVQKILKENKFSANNRIDKYANYHKERFLELRDRFRKWVGDTGRKRSPSAASGSGRVKSIVGGDIHVPFHDQDAVAEVLRQKADRLIIPGDLFDFYSFSRYPKKSKHFTPVEEYQHARAFLHEASARFPEVVVMGGNHDARFFRWLVNEKCIPPDIIEFFNMVHPQFTNPLAKLCSDFDNVIVAEPRRLDYAQYPFLHQIGDCILSHANRYSKLPCKSVHDVAERLKRKLEPMGLFKNFTTIIHAHTHSAGMAWLDWGLYGIDNGCLCMTPEYDGDDRMEGRQPAVGYTVMYQDNGVTDRNETRFIRLK